MILAFLLASFRMATPLLFACMGGLVSERAGVVNMALEAFLLVGAFTAASVAYFSHSPWLALLAAAACGGLIAYFLGLFILKGKVDAIIAGMAFNLLMIGLIPLLSKSLFDSTGSTPSIDISHRFQFEPLVLAILLVGSIYFWLEYTRSGLWVKFAGEHPKALTSEGINPKKVQMGAVVASGIFAACGGASLSLFLASNYSPLMSGGRGFIALAALIFGRWRPWYCFGACLFFGATESLQIQMQGVIINGKTIPVQFIQIIPYISVLLLPILFSFFSKRLPAKNIDS